MAVNWSEMTTEEVFDALGHAPLVAGPWECVRDGKVVRWAPIWYRSGFCLDVGTVERMPEHLGSRVVVCIDGGVAIDVESVAAGRKLVDEKLREAGWRLVD